MDNKEIKKILSTYISLLELHEANPFRIRALSAKIFNLDRLGIDLTKASKEELEQLDGVGKKIADHIISIVDHGSFEELEALISQTPPGVVDMLDIKGIGAKKVRTIWKELGIESKLDLKLACEDGVIAQLSGFGEKTQSKILESLAFEASQEGKGLYATWEAIASEVEETILKKNLGLRFNRAGSLAMADDVLTELEWVVVPENKSNFFESLDSSPMITREKQRSGPFKWGGMFLKEVPLTFHLASEENLGNKTLLLSAEPEFLSTPIGGGKVSLDAQISQKNYAKEEDIFKDLGLPYFQPVTRRKTFLDFKNPVQRLKDLVGESDLKGILHAHSKYSDGQNTLEEISTAVRDQGYSYFGISDHSKSAFYANGLDEDRIHLQHAEIDALNQKLAPFRIFKGIESDILNDGSLDYPNDVLAMFDFIIASIHSNLDMDVRKATARLINAIENPYTTILGHPTGRLLTRRKAYPIDHKMVIDACAEKGVIIELNANPWRLDLDWSWIPYALDKGVNLSINPDAHEIGGIQDVRYGVLAGQKGGLTRDMTFNAQPLKQVEAWFEKRKSQIPA